MRWRSPSGTQQKERNTCQAPASAKTQELKQPVKWLAQVTPNCFEKERACA